MSFTRPLDEGRARALLPDTAPRMPEFTMRQDDDAYMMGALSAPGADGAATRTRRFSGPARPHAPSFSMISRLSPPAPRPGTY